MPTNQLNNNEILIAKAKYIDKFKKNLQDCEKAIEEANTAVTNRTLNRHYYFALTQTGIAYMKHKAAESLYASANKALGMATLLTDRYDDQAQNEIANYTEQHKNVKIKLDSVFKKLPINHNTVAKLDTSLISKL